MKISEVRDNLNSIADKAMKNYESTDDLKAAKTAILAFSQATKTALVQVQYKKLTGKPNKIKFLEE